MGEKNLFFCFNLLAGDTGLWRWCKESVGWQEMVQSLQKWSDNHDDNCMD